LKVNSARFDVAQATIRKVIVEFRFAVRRATVIDEARQFPRHVAIEVELSSRSKCIGCPVAARSDRLGIFRRHIL
jgi:hypothetical protein